jgi:prepilin-type processing-associated H-X9-DG protein
MTCVRLPIVMSIVLMALAAWSPAFVQGQTPSLSQYLAPCVDEQTFVVIRVNLARVDADALFDTAAQAAAKCADADQIAALKDKSTGPRQTVKQRLDEFKAAGGETLYLVWSTNDLPDFLAVIPTAAKANQAGLNTWINAVLNDLNRSDAKQVKKGNFLLVGCQSTLDRWEKASPVALPILDKAAAAAQDATVQVLLVPNQASRQIIGAMLPALAQQGIQIDGNAIANGLQWATLAIDLPPKPSFRLYIQAADADSAAALGKIVTSLLQRVSQIQRLRQASPNLDASLALLTPAAEDNVSRLALDDKQCTQLAADFVAPAVVQAQQEFARLTCGANLSGLGKAILIYANDYNDELPLNLEIMTKTVEVSPRMLRCGSRADKPDAGVPYVYRGVDLGSTAANPDLITIYCRRDHCGGRNVLFLDTHVEWVTEEQFTKLIERDNQLRRQAGLPEKPAE